MNKDIIILLVAQFVTAFADNAALFIAVALVIQTSEAPSWYVPALQAAFLIAFVFLAPWVGRYADQRSKSVVLAHANVVKATGAAMMLVGVEPLLAYAVIGLGAAMYSPAKYGILPELVSSERLVKINSWVEGSTIVAILLGSLIGAYIADHTLQGALAVVLVSYVVSGAIALYIRRIPARGGHKGPVVSEFWSSMKRLLATSRARFATLGVSLFWCAAAVLRVSLVAWAPLVLGFTTSAEIAELTLYIAVGIAVGAFVSPSLIPMERLRRARLAAYAMGLAVLALCLADNVWVARAVLFVAGVCGGLFVVPINAALQDIGHRTIGSGEAVAVQHFFENAAMLAGLSLYSYAAAQGAGPVLSIFVLGIVLLAATFAVSMRLPPDAQRAED